LIFNTFRSKFKDAIAVIREHRGRYEKIPEAIKSQPNWASFGLGESVWANEYAPCSIRCKLVDALIRRVRCEEVARAVKSQPHTVTGNKPKRSPRPLWSQFIDYGHIIRPCNRHKKQIVRAVNCQSLGEKGIWYSGKRALHAVWCDFQNRGMTPRGGVAE